MKFSIVIVTFNRKKALIECLQSICAQSLKIPYEVIVILNGDLAYIEKYKATFPLFKFIHIPQTTKAHARNIAINKVQGESILFLEDDCIIPKNYFQHIPFDLPWDVLGGPVLAASNASPLQTLIDRALASPLCMGPTYKRHSRKSIYDRKATEESLIISNLWFKRSLFKNDGFKFDRDLFKNEEFFLLKEMAGADKIFHHDPELFLYHRRQANLEKLGAALISGEKCRISSFFSSPRKNELIYFMPLIFSTFFFFMIFHPNLFFLICILLYTLAVLIFGMLFYRRLSLRLVLLHFYILFCYNIGLFKGSWISLKNFYNNIKADKSSINESA